MLSAINVQIGLWFVGDIISYLVQGDVYVTAVIESSYHIQIIQPVM